MKSAIYIVLIVFSFQLSLSQNLERQISSTAGETFSNSFNSIDFTVGELVVSTISNNNILTQGFHQGGILVSVKINPIVFLQGPITNPTTPGLMNDDLRANSLIPNLSPYSDGIMIENPVLDVTGSDAIVDWVWVELRDSGDRNVIVEGRSAILQRDGNIVDIDGISAVDFDAIAGNYYLLIQHRNHLSILSATPVMLSDNTTIDLSSDPIDVFGGTDALTNIGSGLFALYGGDTNSDGQILNTDISTVIPLTGTSAYSNSDANMDGQILNTDIQLIIQPNYDREIQY